jgi:Cu2+-containing amine oxidase
MAITGAMHMEHEMVFPNDCYMVGEVTPKRDFDRSSKDNLVQEKDKDTGLPMWVVEVLDDDPEARDKLVRVVILAAHQPVPPEKVGPVRPVEFEGLMVRPYAQTTANGRGKLAWSIKATGMKAPAKAKVPASSNGRNG